jgi:TPR repeat protein
VCCLAPAQALLAHMLIEGTGCEKSEENTKLGINIMALAAEQKEPSALTFMSQMFLYHGDSAKVNFCLIAPLPFSLSR